MRYLNSFRLLKLSLYKKVLFNYTVPQHAGSQLLIAKMYYDVILLFLRSGENNTLYYRASVIIIVFIHF